MSIIQAVLVGIVHGLTAFLPISSSGQIGLWANLWGIQASQALFFEILLHTATLIVVIAAYRKDVKIIVAETIFICLDILTNVRICLENKRTGAGKRYQKISGTNYRKTTLFILGETVPMASIGYLSRHLVKAAFGSLPAISIGLMVSAILLLVMDFIEPGEKEPRNMTFDFAMWMGICQGLAVFPGITRVGISLCVGKLYGMDKKASVKFTFLTAVPAELGGLVLGLSQAGQLSMTGERMAACFLGAAAAGGAGFFLVKRVARYLKEAKFRIFAGFSFVLGIVAIVCSFVK